LHDFFEYLAKHSRLAKAPVPVLGKRRVVRDFLIQIEPREPSIGKMHADFFHQSPLAGDAVEITHQQQSQ